MKTVLPDNTAVCPNVSIGGGAIVVSGPAVTCGMQTTSVASVNSTDIIMDVSCKELYVQGRC